MSRLKPKLTKKIRPEKLFPRYEYTLIDMFPEYQPVAERTPLVSLGVVIDKLLELRGSDINLCFRKEGVVSIRCNGDFHNAYELDAANSYALVEEIFQLQAKFDGVPVGDVRLGWNTNRMDHQTPGGHKVRLIIMVGLSYPWGFDLIARVMLIEPEIARPDDAS